MSGGQHELVLASAGSGKTFRISSRILTLLATGTEPDAIFASTFTRKAAGEILSRVLERLSDAAHGDEAAARLGRELAGLSGREELAARTRTDWQEVLARTVQSLHRFDVSTLDAFFSRAVRAFGHELGLPSGWRIADEATSERLRSRALEEVLARADQGAMVELVRGMAGGEFPRSVHEGLARELDAIREIHRELDPEAPGWEALAEVLGLPGPGAGPSGSEAGDGAPAEADDLRDRGARLAADFEALPVPEKKNGGPLTHWVNAREKILQALTAGDWEGLVGQGLVTKVRNGEETFSRTPIDDAYRRLIGEMLDLARLALGRDYQARARAMARLAEDYDRVLDETLRGAGALRFDDVTRLLSGPGEPGGREDLGYRLDSGIRHLLLDEFQDTSLLQWRALKPLTDRVIGDGGRATTSSVVADPKQSIYGWRGAAPVLVDALREAYAPGGAPLSESWRSSVVVLDTVNRVFAGIARNPVLPEDEGDAATARDWARNFQPHTAARAREGLPGHVTLETGPPRDGTGDLQPALVRHAAERVAELHRTDPTRSIGVLVRRNDAVARMIYELKQRGVEASEEGGTRLTDSPAVVSVLALLRLADHPGNRLARYHVARTPLGPAVGYEDPADAGAARRLSLRLRERLLRDGYGVTLASLRDDLRGACTPRDLHRLDQLVELGHVHDEAAGLRVDDFVTIAERARVEAAGGAPIRVMTVWGSKGLEFDAVVLPDLHLSMRGRGFGGAPLAYRPSPTEPVQHAFPPMKKAVLQLFAEAVPTLAEASAAARAAEMRDALSGLYVAMTRARYALHMVIPAEPDKLSGAQTPARLLRHALDPDPEAATEPGQVLYEAGDPEWWRTAPPGDEAGHASRPGDPTPRRLRLAPRPHRRLLERRKPSDHEVSLDRLLGLERRTAGTLTPKARGSVVHAWMEAVTWLDGGLPDRGERLQLARRELPEVVAGAWDDELDALWEWLRERLEAPEIREALSRASALEAARAFLDSAPAGPWGGLALEVENELPFLHREGGTLMEGVIDRLVLVRGERSGGPGMDPGPRGAPRPVLAAHVLDYKTDAIAPGDAAGLERSREHYAPQLRAYRSAVASLYGIPAERVRTTLLFLEARRAVGVD